MGYDGLCQIRGGLTEGQKNLEGPGPMSLVPSQSFDTVSRLTTRRPPATRNVSLRRGIVSRLCRRICSRLSEMDITKMLAELKAENEGISQAILVLERIASGRGKRRGRPPKWMTQVQRRGR